MSLLIMRKPGALPGVVHKDFVQIILPIFLQSLSAMVFERKESWAFQVYIIVSGNDCLIYLILVEEGGTNFQVKVHSRLTLTLTLDFIRGASQDL